MNLSALASNFPDHNSDLENLEDIRWRDNPRCLYWKDARVARNTERKRVGCRYGNAGPNSLNIRSGPSLRKGDPPPAKVDIGSRRPMSRAPRAQSGRARKAKRSINTVSYPAPKIRLGAGPPQLVRATLDQPGWLPLNGRISRPSGGASHPRTCGDQSPAITTGDTHTIEGLWPLLKCAWEGTLHSTPKTCRCWWWKPGKCNERKNLNAFGAGSCEGASQEPAPFWSAPAGPSCGPTCSWAVSVSWTATPLFTESGEQRH